LPGISPANKPIEAKWNGRKMQIPHYFATHHFVIPSLRRLPAAGKDKMM